MAAPQFLSTLDLRLVRAATPHRRAVWQVRSPLRYQSALPGVGIIEVPKGRYTDLASVPRTLLAWFIAGGLAEAPAVVHDELYGGRIGTRAMADRVLYEATGVEQYRPMDIEALPRWRRWAIYRAVRLFGGGAWKGDTRITRMDGPHPGIEI